MNPSKDSSPRPEVISSKVVVIPRFSRQSAKSSWPKTSEHGSPFSSGNCSHITTRWFPRSDTNSMSPNFSTYWGSLKVLSPGSSAPLLDCVIEKSPCPMTKHAPISLTSSGTSSSSSSSISSNSSSSSSDTVSESSDSVSSSSSSSDMKPFSKLF